MEQFVAVVLILWLNRIHKSVCECVFNAQPCFISLYLIDLAALWQCDSILDLQLVIIKIPFIS